MGKQIRKTMVHYVIGTILLLSLYLFLNYLIPAHLRISDMRKRTVKSQVRTNAGNETSFLKKGWTVPVYRKKLP